MASVRLTNEIREAITTAMLRHRFAKELEKIVRMRAKLADRVYRDVYSAADRKKMEELPEGWLPSDSDIQFRAGIKYARVGYNGSIYGELNRAMVETPEIVSRNVPYRYIRSCVKTYDAGHPISEAYSEAETALKDITERHRDAKRQIEVALARASTTGRLVDLWPEAAPFCKRYEDASPSLPAIQTSALNALLDLPVSAAA